jgi:uncharacterized membrane protein YciS (DUF1049 family)
MGKAADSWQGVGNALLAALFAAGTITAAVLDRLLHHSETVVIEGSTYRMKDQTRRTPDRAPSSTQHW